MPCQRPGFRDAAFRVRLLGQPDLDLLFAQPFPLPDGAPVFRRGYRRGGLPPGARREPGELGRCGGGVPGDRLLAHRLRALPRQLLDRIPELDGADRRGGDAPSRPDRHHHPAAGAAAGISFRQRGAAISHGLDGLRDAYAGAGLPTIATDLGIEAGIGVVYAVLGFFVFRTIEAYARRSGTYDRA